MPQFFFFLTFVLEGSDDKGEDMMSELIRDIKGLYKRLSGDSCSKKHKSYCLPPVNFLTLNKW